MAHPGKVYPLVKHYYQGTYLVYLVTRKYLVVPYLVVFRGFPGNMYPNLWIGHTVEPAYFKLSLVDPYKLKSTQEFKVKRVLVLVARYSKLLFLFTIPSKVQYSTV